MKRLAIRKPGEDEGPAQGIGEEAAPGTSQPAAPKGVMLDQVPLYEELLRLLLAAHERSMRFPDHELTELGADLRRASNAAAAVLAGGWASRDSEQYREAVCACMGKIQETLHHLTVACRKGYLNEEHYKILQADYSECLTILDALHQSLARWEFDTGGGNVPRAAAWQQTVNATLDVMRVFA